MLSWNYQIAFSKNSVFLLIMNNKGQLHSHRIFLFIRIIITDGNYIPNSGGSLQVCHRTKSDTN